MPSRSEQKFFLSSESKNYLTKREAEIFYYMIFSHTNKSTANKLKIKERTVEFHIQNITFKFELELNHNITDRSILVTFAHDSGLKEDILDYFHKQ